MTDRRHAKALIAGGVAPRLCNAAARYLVRELDLQVEETDDHDFDVSVIGPYGATSVQFAVDGWLETEEGMAYRPEHHSPEAGMFSQQMAQLKATMH